MNVALRQRLPGLLLLLAGLLLAGGSFWVLEMTRRSGDETTPASARTEPDYFAENFRYTKLTTSGSADYMIEGEKLVHDPVSDHTDITQPFMRSYSGKRLPMSVRAERARINADHTEVRLFDHVVLERPQTKDQESLTVRSEFMLVLPEQDIVKSDRLVDITLGEARLSGTGMVADNAAHELKLLSRVSGSYPPPSKK